MKQKILWRSAVLIAAVFSLVPPNFKANAQSPTSIGGRTIQSTISSGTFPFASSGSFRFLPSAVDASYAVVPVSGNVTPSTGTHTYTKTGPDTARLSLVDTTVGGLSVNCTFSTPTSGTCTTTSTAFPGASQAGTFVLYASASPATVAGTTVTVTITSGESPFAGFGSYRFLPATSGNTYTIVALSGSVGNSSGTYSYIQNSAYTGLITFNDSFIGQGVSSQLSFDSPTTGTLFLRKSGSTGYQTGLFSMTTPEAPVFGMPTWSQGNVFAVEMHGQPNTVYRIQWSSNLVNWLDLTNVVSTGTLLQVQDTGTATGMKRFYRAVSP